MTHDIPQLDASSRKPRLLDQVRRLLQARHMSPKTVKSYLGWIRRYILFHGKRHPAELAEGEVNAFLWAALASLLLPFHPLH